MWKRALRKLARRILGLAMNSLALTRETRRLVLRLAETAPDEPTQLLCYSALERLGKCEDYLRAVDGIVDRLASHRGPSTLLPPAGQMKLAI